MINNSGDGLRNLHKRRLVAASAIIGSGAALNSASLFTAESAPLVLRIITVVVVLVSVITLLLVHQGYIKIASWMFTVCLLIAIVFAVPPLQAMSSFFILAYILPVTVAGLVGSHRTVLCVGILLLLAITSMLIINPIETPRLGVLLVLLVVVNIGLLWLVLRDLHYALNRSVLLAQETNAAYGKIQQERAQITQMNQQLLTANEEQRRLFDTIQDLEAPVLTLQNRILIIPLIGHIDTHRAQAITDRVLHAAHQYKAHGIVIDISGVVVVDTQVMQRIISLIQALRLMGCKVVISGIKPAMAQTIVILGIDFGFDTFSTGSLQDGITQVHTMIGELN